MRIVLTVVLSVVMLGHFCSIGAAAKFFDPELKILGMIPPNQDGISIRVENSEVQKFSGQKCPDITAWWGFPDPAAGSCKKFWGTLRVFRYTFFKEGLPLQGRFTEEFELLSQSFKGEFPLSRRINSLNIFDGQVVDFVVLGTRNQPILEAIWCKYRQTVLWNGQPVLVNEITITAGPIPQECGVEVVHKQVRPPVK